MSTHSMPRNKNVTLYYICGCACNVKTPCEHTRYHRATDLEERVRFFTVSLLKRPEVIREQTRAFIEIERRRFRDPDGQIRSLLEHLDRIERKQRGYREQNAEGLIPLDELKSVLSELENQKKVATDELAVLRDRETYLANLEKMARDFILDLPFWLDGLGSEPDPNPNLYREVYEKLGYRLVVHKEGTLNLTFGAEGEAHLPPDYGKRKPPEPPLPPDDPAWETGGPATLPQSPRPDTVRSE